MSSSELEKDRYVNKKSSTSYRMNINTILQTKDKQTYDMILRGKLFNQFAKRASLDLLLFSVSKGYGAVAVWKGKIETHLFHLFRIFLFFYFRFWFSGGHQHISIIG